MPNLTPLAAATLMFISASCLADVDLMQNGDDNTAQIEQINVDASVQASINQSGTRNNGFIQQEGVTEVDARLLQEGNANVAQLYQAGGVSQSSINLEQRGEGNEAWISQNGNMGKSYSGEQAGNDNTLRVEMNGQYAFLESSSIGDRNAIDAQVGSYSAVRIYQLGDDNEALYQLSGSGTVTQTGNRNLATFAGYGEGEMTVGQTGSDNELHVTKSSAYGDRLTGQTTGDNNRVEVDQSGQYVIVLDYTQTGDNNQMNLQQSSFQGGYMGVAQSGNDNVLAASQQGGSLILDGSTEGDNNRVEIDQNGEGGTLRYTQTGDSNTLLVSQSASYSSPDTFSNAADAHISMNGNENLIELDQNGSGTVTIDQAGDLNIARVQQSDYHENPGSALVSQVGSSNDAAIQQTVNGATATLSQVGNGNQASIIQQF